MQIISIIFLVIFRSTNKCYVKRDFCKLVRFLVTLSITKYENLTFFIYHNVFNRLTRMYIRALVGLFVNFELKLLKVNQVAIN